ncbi:hypothetical protein Ahia01_000199100 [Argonauta hians]
MMGSDDEKTVQQSHYYIDDKKILWGKEGNEKGSAEVITRGHHQYPFQFQLPESTLPCSFESRLGTVRYSLKLFIHLPYDSPPQGVKYFTIIGPQMDYMVDKYLTPHHVHDEKHKSCFCCGTGPLVLNATLDRSVYCCGENIQLKAEIQNNSNENVWLVCTFIQYGEFFINKGIVSTQCRDVSYQVFQIESQVVAPSTVTTLNNLSPQLQVPSMPPTMINVCSCVELFYSLKVFLHMEKSGDIFHIEFPITIGTVPFHVPNSPPPPITYQKAVSHVEGGNYVSSKFLLGGVYTGCITDLTHEQMVLYQPVYVCVQHTKIENSSPDDKSNKNTTKEETKMAAVLETTKNINKDVEDGIESTAANTTTVGMESVTIESVEFSIVGERLKVNGGGGGGSDRNSSGSGGSGDGPSIEDKIASMTLVQQYNSTVNINTNAAYTADSFTTTITTTTATAAAANNLSSQKSEISNATVKSWNLEEHSEETQTKTTTTATTTTTTATTTTTTATTTATMKTAMTTTAETAPIQKKKINASEEECETESLPKENSESINIAPT